MVGGSLRVDYSNLSKSPLEGKRLGMNRQPRVAAHRRMPTRLNLMFFFENLLAKGRRR